MPPPATPNPTCPRCGYDQSGAIATWTGACPCAGLCPECGLEFRWTDLFNPDRKRLRWLYEHVRGLGARAYFQSLAMAAIPSRFWSRVRMTHSISVRRLVATLAVALIGGYALGTVSSAIALIIWYKPFYAQYVMNVGGQPSWSDYLLHLASNPGERAGLLWRSAFPWDITVRATADQLIQAAVRPFSRLLLLTHASAALILLALPQTRARAKVRPAHVLRAATYPIALILILTWIAIIINHQIAIRRVVVLWIPRPSTSKSLELAITAIGLLYAAWWWLLVCRTYLKLPQPTLVWLAAIGTATLATLTAIIVIQNEVLGWT